MQTTFRWPPYPGAKRYYFYIWVWGKEKPSAPNGIVNNYWRSFTPNTPLTPDTKYSWQLEFDIGGNSTVPGPKWAFQTRKVPDLVVERISVPSVAFSGQLVTIRWSVRNKGNGTTNDQSWNDIIYVSKSDDFNDARRQGLYKYVYQRNILFSMDGYNLSTKKFMAFVRLTL